MKKIDLTGQRFGRLIVLEKLPERRRQSVCWLCRCNCGNKHVAITAELRKGRTNSCGCLQREGVAERSRKRIRHGYLRDGQIPPEYNAYRAARQRSRYPKSKFFEYYGGRGIEFRFTSFEQFLAELGLRPSEKYSVDRIDNNGHYEPGNVRWATREEQQANQRRRQV